jgi:rubrerythrin
MLGFEFRLLTFNFEVPFLHSVFCLLSRMAMELIWKCLRCGYITQAGDPPDRCPNCGAGREEFEHVEED